MTTYDNKLTMLYQKGLKKEVVTFATLLHYEGLRIDKKKVLVFDSSAFKAFRSIRLNKIKPLLISLIGQKRFDGESKRIHNINRSEKYPYGRCFGISLKGEALVCNFQIMDWMPKSSLTSNVSIKDAIVLPLFTLQYINPVSCSVCPKRSINHCARCKSQRYCSVECQKKDWSEHRKICTLVEGIIDERPDAELKYVQFHELEIMLDNNIAPEINSSSSFG